MRSGSEWEDLTRAKSVSSTSSQHVDDINRKRLGLLGSSLLVKRSSVESRKRRSLHICFSEMK